MAGKTQNIDLENPCQEAVFAASSLLKQGKLIVYPSDTVYGILADAHDKNAVMLAAKMKGYSSHRPFIVLVKSLDRALDLVSTHRVRDLFLVKEYLQNSHTVVLAASKRAPECSISADGSIAIRIPLDILTKKLLNLSGLDLISTSANLKTEAFPLSLKQIPHEILTQASLCLDAGELVNRLPSSIFDLRNDSPIQLR